MRINICAVGRLRASPERDLTQDYLDRFDRTGRSLGLGPVNLVEVEDKKGGGMVAEALLLNKAIPDGSLICILDERGTVMGSPEFSQLLCKWRDQGQSSTAFVIGGADGIHRDLRAKSNISLSFGKMVWPHMLVRVMLAEQLYRAATILAGGPYHRA
ncbi:MAG: 23S rRNA (pseudouridine(1915)-N(3))-methyltransferase RlmH [Paracoccaceae bacterium]